MDSWLLFCKCRVEIAIRCASKDADVPDSSLKTMAHDHMDFWRMLNEVAVTLPPPKLQSFAIHPPGFKCAWPKQLLSWLSPRQVSRLFN